MKICYLADAGSLHVYKVVKYFAEDGNNVYLFSFLPHTISIADEKEHTSIESVIREKYADLDVNLYLFKKYPFPSKVVTTLGGLKINMLMKSINPDVLHAFYIYPYGFLGSLLNLHPYIISVLGSDILIPPVHSKKARILTMYTLSKANCITTTSIFLAANVYRYLNRKKEVITIPFGVDANKFKPLRKSKKSMIIGTTKHLEPIYGIKYLIMSLPEIVAYFPNIKVWLIGIKGSNTKDIEKLIDRMGLQNVVEIKGFIPHDLVPDYISQMDVVAIPSLSEGFGVSALEAQAMEVPVVATNVGGLREVVKNGTTGFLVPPKDHRKLAKAIITLLSDDQLREKMGKAGRKYVIERYRWDVCITKMKELYNKLSSN